MTHMKLGLIALCLAALGFGPAHAAETHTVYMSNFQYCADPVCEPPLDGGASHDITITAGDTVEWVFADPQCYVFDAVIVPFVFGEGDPFVCYHDVSWLDSTPASPKMAIDPTSYMPTALTYSRTFTAAGTYPFACSLHGSPTNMVGTITVNEAT